MQGLEQSGSNTAHWMLLFPGQGTQHIGMGADVSDQSATTARVWDCASDIAGFDVRRICSKGPMPKLDKTGFQQVAVTTVNIATLEALRSSVPELSYSAVAGHSVGEFAALYAAGVLSLEDVFRGVSARGRIMQELAEEIEGAMYAIKGIDHCVINAFITEHGLQQVVQVANDNTPKQQVISGTRDGLRELMPLLLKAGFESIRLPVNGAWHSHLMRAGSTDFEGVLDSLSFAPARIAVHTNQSTLPLNSASQIKTDIARNLYSTVRWRETILNLLAQPVGPLLEVGPKRILSRMLNDFSHTQDTLSARHADDLLAAIKRPRHEASELTGAF